MIPVSVVTGFLGSGKTTLLNRLLDRRPPARGKMALIVNEFGDVGIDADLLPEEMTRQVELPGGCICCALDEDLEKTLLGLVAGEPELELVVVETTGIAEPLPISWTLGREPLAAQVRLHAVITVVDAVEHERNRQVAQSVDPQVEYADILVVSKVDLSPDAEPPEPLVRGLRALNPAAPVLSGEPGRIADLLWSSLLDPSLEAPRAGRTPAPEALPGHDHDHDHDRDPATALRDAHGFESVSVPIETTLDFEELETQLEELPPDYVRIKGVARVVDASTGSTEPRTVAFHRVGARVSAEPIDRQVAGRLVALGPRVSRERLAACIAASVLP